MFQGGTSKFSEIASGQGGRAFWFAVTAPPVCRVCAQRKGGAHEQLQVGPPEVRSANDTERPRAAMSAPTPLPSEISRSVHRGELQKVVKWVRKGGLVDALCSDIAADGRLTTAALLHAASGEGQLEMVRELNPFLSTEK